MPPLARRSDAARSVDYEQSERIVRHIAAAGVTGLIYGGNAFLYHITLAEYAGLLDWLGGLPRDLLVIPSAGPSFGRAMDQAPLLGRHKFPCVMMLPCADPRDAAGLERGWREVAGAAGLPLMLYLKDESNLGADKPAGLDAVARLVADGVCVAIKYAVVREWPARDAYLDELLKRVDRSRVISGIGERPAIAHLRGFELPGFTTGSGCIAPALSRALLEACAAGDGARAEQLRAAFLPLEDLRDAWGPARVLHAATELAGIATTGPIPPFVSPLSAAQRERLAPVARALVEQNERAAAAVGV